MKTNHRFFLAILKNMPVILFVVIFVVFSLLDQRFFTWTNFENIIFSSAFVGIIAIGMTFVLLTGGIDLSVGAAMYISGATTGLLLEKGWNVWVVIVLALAFGTLLGVINGLLVSRLKIIPFMVTLGTMTAGRGLALLITNSRALTFPPVIKVGSVRVFGLIPVPILALLVVVIIAVIILKYTPLGRQIYALGNDPEAAKKAGLDYNRLIMFVYIASAFCASLGAIIAITTQGRVSSSYGEGIEFRAIAAAVLGGTSLFGGVGNVFPGTVVGLMLMQMISNGLVYLQVDLYFEDMINALVIFLAIFIDAQRMGLLKRLERRNIRMERKLDHGALPNRASTD